MDRQKVRMLRHEPDFAMETNTMKQVMKQILVWTFTTLVTGAMASAQTQPQPLGDYARAVKKTKPAPQKSSKTYDNDNIPRNTTLSVVGAEKSEPGAGNDSTSQDESASPTTPDEKADSAKKAEELPQVKAGQSSEDRQKAIADWKQKIDDQKGKVDLLSRELNVLQRELDVKRADFYSSTARAVQNSRGFDEEESKYKQQIADKQKSLDGAKAKLDELQEQARKSGVPNSARE
jgi:hypothetical protein